MLFEHIFIDNRALKTLVLLHGTGGTKSDFLFLNDRLQKTFNLLALQGNVLEQGMPRFFRRIRPGVFDQDNIKKEAEKLHQFVSNWRSEHSIQVNDLVFLGYSNGANMILATLFYHPQSIRFAVLLHPMLPFIPQDISLKEHSLLVSAGLHDPMVSLSQQKILEETLIEKDTNVIIKKYPGGHELSNQEIKDVIEFLNSTKVTINL